MDVRSDFPLLAREIDGKPIVYLDSAATAQKPAPVLEAMDDFYRRHYALDPPRRLHAREPSPPRPSRAPATASRAFAGGEPATTIFTANATRLDQPRRLRVGPRQRAAPATWC